MGMKYLTAPETKYILNTMQDGVISVNKTGMVTYINEVAERLVATEKTEIIGHRLAEKFFENEKNDDFIQTVVDAVCEPDRIISKKINYWYENGEGKCFFVKTSVIKDEENQKQGVTFLISDITEDEEQKRRIHDLTVNFVLFIGLLCSYVFFYAMTKMVWGDSFPKALYNWLIMLISLVLTVFLSYSTSKKFSFTFLKVGKDRFKHDMKFVVGFCLGATLLMIVVKLVLMYSIPGIFPPNKPFFNYYRFLPSGMTVAHSLYFLTSFFQEVLARKVAQETMEEIFVGAKGSIIAVFISSIMFGVLHLHYGFFFMVGCFLYLTVLGFYYRKNRNIWNCVILHLVLGDLFVGFGFASI